VYPDIAYGGGIREENKVIYFYPSNSSQEYLLYDFNAFTGDTIISAYNTSVDSDTLIVYSRDTINHKQVFSNEVIREGIGSSHGPVSPSYDGNSIQGFYTLVCFTRNGVIEYGGGTKCVTDIEESISERLLNIYPNPANNNFTLTSSTIISGIAIFSVDGILQQSHFINSPEAIVPIDNLANGIYLVCIQTVNGSVIKRLAIQK
jgi:hypothetical protein